MQALRRELDHYNATESELSDQQLLDADNAYRRSTLLAGVGLVVCVIAIALITGYLSRRLFVQCGGWQGWRNDWPMATSRHVYR
jgi:hypothetical protein